MSKRVRKEL